MTNTRRVLHLLVLGFMLFPAAFAIDRTMAADQPKDKREILALTARERDHMLAGMRTYLESVQGIIEGLAMNKLGKAGEAAAKSGKRLLDSATPAVALAVPLSFTQMSLDTHDKFDALAEKVKRGSSKIEVMNDLAAILANCTACHATFRIGSPR